MLSCRDNDIEGAAGKTGESTNTDNHPFTNNRKEYVADLCSCSARLSALTPASFCFVTHCEVGG